MDDREWHPAPESRTIVARTSKAWDQNDVDVFEILKQVAAECPLTAIQLEMQVAFGLRMKESLCIIPRVADRGSVLSVVWGTKGGLPREVRFDDDMGVAAWQRDVLERAKLMADQNKKGTLSLQGKTLEQSRDRFYYIVRKYGVSRSGLGVTVHGLRHQFAARRYQEISGFGAPVTAHAPAISETVTEADLQARTELSRELGHFRPSITQAYTGSFRMRKKDATKRVKEWVKRTEGDPRFLAVMAKHGISRAWLGGSFAEGLEVGPHEKLRLFLAPASGQPLDAETRFLLKNALNEIYRRGVDITIHTDKGDPDDCVELYLPEKPKSRSHDD